MSARKADRDSPWVVTCDLLENHSQEFSGKLTEAELREALREEGWVLPIYGGTFCESHYHALKRLTGK